MRTHTKEKPYEWMFAGSVLVNPSHLKRHMRDSHERNPYECDFCDKVFRDSSEFEKAHAYAHERPYECDMREVFVNLIFEKARVFTRGETALM